VHSHHNQFCDFLHPAVPRRSEIPNAWFRFLVPCDTLPSGLCHAVSWCANDQCYGRVVGPFSGCTRPLSAS
jgi:hypothetical protein